MEAIVAVYRDWGIGCAGTQPVVVSADRRHFRAVTGSDTVIVGRKTLADFPGGKPLKNRCNILLTTQDTAVEGAVVVHSVAEALEAARPHQRVLVIGGESVYRAFFPHIDCVYVTKIDAEPHSDAFFPDLDADEDWYVADPGEDLEENGLHYRFMTYRRREKN